ncbi:MAG: hypothetical protein VKL59_02245 [Nostocaceae cyanobacterium]|nr:hypothetical protein [Nostocaceae cyanobacterium]
MNYQKLDTSLSMALNDVEDPEAPTFVVFIHTKTTPTASASAILNNLGVHNASSGKDVFTATLSANAISQLSEQPWVQYLRLSQKLRLVNSY